MKAIEYYRSTLPPCTSNSHCFQSGFFIMVSIYTIPIPQAFRGRQGILNSCPALSKAAQPVTWSSCLCKASHLAPRSLFRLILLQKHVETDCNPWRWEKEGKGAGCFMELHGGGVSSPMHNCALYRASCLLWMTPGPTVTMLLTRWARIHPT